MNKDELVRKLAEEFGISTIDIYQLVNTVIGSMSGALSKGKNINISEFGKFKTLSRKDEAGKTVKTVSFSPVKKFANEVNFRYNDLSPTPMGLHREEADDLKTEVYEEEVTLIEEVSENITFDTKNLSENINPSVMDNRDKYDGNIIRDEISKDSSNEDTINAFINSKLDKSQHTEIKEESGIKEFELPHTLIELHNDITNIDEPFEEKEETPPIEPPEINDNIDIESLIEERKKALEDITPEYESESMQGQTNDDATDDTVKLHVEDRDQLDEFRSFEEERNAELSKIIAERNKIIDDIQEMVNNTDDIPEMKESPVKETPIEEKSFESPVESDTKNSFENPIENPFEQKPVEDLPPLQEDKTFEHKFQYEETNLIHDNFDPIVTDDELSSSQKVDYTDNDILTPEDTQSFKTESKHFEKTPTSFEDVFETKDEAEKQKNLIHSSLPPVNQDKPNIEAVTPPVPDQKPAAHTIQKSESYTQKMQKREQMYVEQSNKSMKKGLWITAIVLGFLVLIIYLAYNTGSFSPTVEQPDGNQQNSEQQNNQNNNNEQTPPPVSNEQKQETTPDNSKQENPNTTEQNQPPSTNAPEEVVFDNSLNVAYIKTSDGVYIQTASLKNKSDADKMASGINKGNKEVFVKEADLGDKGKYYRVRIGKFASMEEAKEFAGKLK